MKEASVDMFQSNENDIYKGINTDLIPQTVVLSGSKYLKTKLYILNIYLFRTRIRGDYSIKFCQYENNFDSYMPYQVQLERCFVYQPPFLFSFHGSDLARVGCELWCPCTNTYEPFPCRDTQVARWIRSRPHCQVRKPYKCLWKIPSTCHLKFFFTKLIYVFIMPNHWYLFLLYFSAPMLLLFSRQLQNYAKVQDS